MTSREKSKLCEIKYKELGCQCHVDSFLGDILNENPDCKYHNWLDEMYQSGGFDSN